jgi:hypothetical protein
VQQGVCGENVTAARRKRSAVHMGDSPTRLLDMSAPPATSQGLRSDSQNPSMRPPRRNRGRSQPIPGGARRRARPNELRERPTISSTRPCTSYGKPVDKHCVDQ